MPTQTSPNHPGQPIVFTGCIEATALGDIWVAVSECGLVALEIQSTRKDFEKRLAREPRLGSCVMFFDPIKTSEAVRQVREYLNGDRREFSLSIDWSVMGDFQQRALQATAAIPYGQTRTYGSIAAQIGQPNAARAVGRAEATNPMPIVLPCHRVLGADGELHGYRAPGGLKSKAWLLQLERLS